MLAHVSERAGHPAATGVEIDDGRFRYAGQQRFRGWKQSHGLLMAMSVEHDLCGTGPQVEAIGVPIQEILEERAGFRYAQRLLLAFAAQQRRYILTHCGKA